MGKKAKEVTVTVNYSEIDALINATVQSAITKYLYNEKRLEFHVESKIKRMINDDVRETLFRSIIGAEIEIMVKEYIKNNVDKILEDIGKSINIKDIIVEQIEEKIMKKIKGN